MKKDKHGYYTKTFTYNGRRIFVKAKTQTELFEKVMKRKKELELENDKIYNPTLREYYEQYTNRRRKELRESTLRAQQSQIKAILDYKERDGRLFGDRKLREITRKDIEHLRDLLFEQGKSAPTLNTTFSHLHNVFKSALTDETIDRNPAKALKPLKRNTPPIGKTRHRALSEEETKEFFKVAKKRDSFFYNNYLFLIKTGVRIGELSALTISDVDRKRGLIHISKTVHRNEIGGYEIGDNTKTISGSRDIPLTDELLHIIDFQAKNNHIEYSQDSLIFPNKRGKILKEQSINRDIRLICEEACLEPFTCHAFRNTFATRWIEQRPNSYKVLSEILGHKDVGITLNLYTHVMQEQKIREMGKVSISVD